MAYPYYSRITAHWLIMFIGVTPDSSNEHHRKFSRVAYPYYSLITAKWLIMFIGVMPDSSNEHHRNFSRMAYPNYTRHCVHY